MKDKYSLKVNPKLTQTEAACIVGELIGFENVNAGDAFTPVEVTVEGKDFFALRDLCLEKGIHFLPA